MGSVPQISTSEPRAVFDTPFKLGESPIWDVDHQRLLFVDQKGRRIHVLHPADGRHTSVATQELTPAIILTENPDVLVVPMEQVRVRVPAANARRRTCLLRMAMRCQATLQADGLSCRQL